MSEKQCLSEWMNNECLKSNATRISQSLSILVSHDPCCYLSSKKLVWFNFQLKFQGFKFSYKSVFFKNFRTLPMISKLSPVAVWHFQQKNGSRTEKVYYLESGLLIAKWPFFSTFWYWRCQIHAEIQVSLNFYQ